MQDSWLKAATNNEHVSQSLGTQIMYKINVNLLTIYVLLCIFMYKLPLAIANIAKIGIPIPP